MSEAKLGWTWDERGMNSGWTRDEFGMNSGWTRDEPGMNLGWTRDILSNAVMEKQTAKNLWIKINTIGRMSNSFVPYHGIICKQHQQHSFLLFCHCYAPRGFFVCIDAISHLSTGDRNDKLRLRDRLTLLLCCNCICRKEVQHYGILVQSPTLSDFFCTWYFADVEFRPVSGAFFKFCYIRMHIFLQLNSIQFTNSTMAYLLWIPATYLLDYIQN